MQLKAGSDRCEEASPLSSQVYIPCNMPATWVVKTRDPRPYRMCETCANHNTRNRGAVILEAFKCVSS